jgi:hypothetical protein
MLKIMENIFINRIKIKMKLVLTVCYSENIKFKFTFDTKNNTKTFKQLKIECVEKLQGFT